MNDRSCFYEDFRIYTSFPMCYVWREDYICQKREFPSGQNLYFRAERMRGKPDIFCYTLHIFLFDLERKHHFLSNLDSIYHTNSHTTAMWRNKRESGGREHVCVRERRSEKRKDKGRGEKGREGCVQEKY